MRIFCNRLPATDDTLVFLSSFMEKTHIQKYIDPFWKTYFGIYELFFNIRNGAYRAYGAFELDDDGDPVRFLGFQLCMDDGKGKVETHCFWDRKTPVFQCVKLLKEKAVMDYAKDGNPVKCFVGYIPEDHVAARRLALSMGFRCCGAMYGWDRVVGGNIVRTMEYRLDEGA